MVYGKSWVYKVPDQETILSAHTWGPDMGFHKLGGSLFEGSQFFESILIWVAVHELDFSDQNMDKKQITWVLNYGKSKQLECGPGTIYADFPPSLGSYDSTCKQVLTWK